MHVNKTELIAYKYKNTTKYKINSNIKVSNMTESLLSHSSKFISKTSVTSV